MNATIGPTNYPSIDAFLDARASGDGSRHTLTSYRHDLIGFARWFAEHVPTEPGFAPDAVTPTDVREFRDWLVRTANRKPSTVNRKLAALRAYFSFCKATADRILRPHRERDAPHGMTTTRRGLLIKQQVPVRTFTGWDDVVPGFFEADLVAHCGPWAEGAFLQTLVLTDVATGWTECLALLHRSQHTVIQGIDRLRTLLPVPLLGLDTDNGTEFLNTDLLDYCTREEITFTRGRVAKKNDQCFVEQKNGAIVRQLVGYDRFEGEQAYRQLAELYRAVRLYVNFFQPSMKLRVKEREGGKLRRR